MVEQLLASKRAETKTARRVSVATTPYLFILPALSIFMLFLIYPIYFAFRLSFFDWSGFTDMGQMNYLGVQNYRELWRDSIFWLALRQTVSFAVVSTLAQMVVAFLLAFTLYYFRPRFAQIMRAIFFFPSVLSAVMVALTWQRILNPSGLLDQLLTSGSLGFLSTEWLANPKVVLWAIIGVGTWQWAGWTMVLYYAGLVGIPLEYFETAKVEGAKTLQIVRYVALPLVKHVTEVALLLNIVGGFQVFDTIYVLTRGGPAHHSEVLSTYIYFNAFDVRGPNLMGYASAIAVALITILFAFSYLRIRASKLV